MSIQFPDKPSLNETFPYAGMTYVWDGEKWTASGAAAFEDAYVNKDGDTMTGNLTLPSLNGGPLAGLRNQLINGDFRIRQYFNNTTGANKYITDRWCTNDNTTGATPDVTDVQGAAKGLRLDGGGRVIRQLVELPGDGLAGQFYNGSQWTMSIYSTVAPNQLDVRFVEGGTTIGTSVPITGVPAWTATTDVQGAYTRYTCTFTVNVNPDATSKAFRVSWSFSSAATFTLAQLEPGPQPTPFEHRPITLEKQLCSRYYQEIDLVGPVSGYSNHQRGYFKYPEMRAAPTFLGADSWTIISAQQTPGSISSYKTDPNTGGVGTRVASMNVDATGWTHNNTSPSQGQGLPCRITAAKLDAEL